MKNIVIFGAASGGRIIADAISQQQERYSLKCFLDNDKKLWGGVVSGVTVLGGSDNLAKVLVDYDVHELIVAISNIDKAALSSISKICNEKQIELRVIPDSLNIVLEDPILNQLREIDIVDLLGREEVYIRSDFIADHVKGKVVAITGAAGSIGSEIVRQVSKFSPSKILAIDLNENDLYLLALYISRHFPEIEFVSSICSVQDYNSIKDELVGNSPDILFHCAAHKHVPLMERAPFQAVKNNVYGTYNVATAAEECGVERFVLISTDKAVNPANVMGASKRMAELMVLSLNKGLNQCEKNTKFMVVRFGNVLGSAGSVVPIFKELLKEGKDLTVTDKNMTRYFMTIPEAARLVIEAGYTGSGGELFVLDMGNPVKINELAQNMIDLSGAQVKINYVGLRPGEKLYEELFYDETKVLPTVNSKILISRSEVNTTISLDSMVNAMNKVLSHEYNPKSFLHDFVPSYLVGK